MNAPEITTDRLCLRGWRADDYEPYAAFRADGALNRLSGGARTRVEAWNEFCAMIGQWTARGFGIFAVEERDSSATAGYAGLWYPVDIDEPELCWSLFADFHGQGYATEAAVAARDWAGEAIGLPPLMSFVHPDNAPSRRVAERLGAACEGDTELRGEPRLFYRHAPAQLN